MDNIRERDKLEGVVIEDESPRALHGENEVDEGLVILEVCLKVLDGGRALEGEGS